jgi:hypothetical protein
VFIVLDVVDRLVSATVWDVEPAPNISVMPVTSQSPAVSDMLVQFFAVPDVRETFEPFVAATYSPILPDAALSFVDVPVMGPEIVLLAPEIVLFVRVSVVARPTSVSVAVGRVTVPVLEIDDMMGAVRVLPDNVWVSVVPTRFPDGSPFPPSWSVFPPVPLNVATLPLTEETGPVAAPIAALKLVAFERFVSPAKKPEH